MAQRHNSIRIVLLAGGLLAAWPVFAADVTGSSIRTLSRKTG
jgi:cytochrome bd-type quinol oxidase subunit 2